MIDRECQSELCDSILSNLFYSFTSLNVSYSVFCVGIICRGCARRWSRFAHKFVKTERRTQMKRCDCVSIWILLFCSRYSDVLTRFWELVLMNSRCTNVFFWRLTIRSVLWERMARKRQTGPPTHTLFPILTLDSCTIWSSTRLTSLLHVFWY